MKIKMDFARILKECLEISEFFFMDTLMDNFDQDGLCYFFSDILNKQAFARQTKNLYYDMVFYINNKIMLEYNIDYLKTLIKRNNSYLSSNPHFLNWSNEALKEEFAKNIPVGLYNFSISPNMLLLYYFSKNVFKGEKIEFLKEEYLKVLERIKAELGNLLSRLMKMNLLEE